MRRSRCFGAALAATLTVSTVLVSGPARGDDELYKPQVAGPSPEASQAAKSIRLAPGLKLELFAAEPLLANPVAFCIDDRGRVFVAETFRLHAGATDNRSHMDWLDADMASKSVADRVAMYKKFLSPQEFQQYQVEHERVKLIEDRTGDGKADHATVFADGFKDAADGIGAGLLARKGDVYYACIPDLWRLRDNDGDGKADVKESLSTGYGVHVAFLGHDLHGLKMGPDGRIYFSVGDRGLNVTTREGKHLFAPDCGSVLRCEPDGSNLEIFASGLRNPQELAFDDHGNLFTCDNNSDGGDKARWVHVVEGSDSGWRMGYQYLEFPTSRGPWNAEKLWHPRWDGQAAYIVPPIINISDGPSGLVHDPGTGLPARYRDHFFLADFRGGAGNSGIRSFANKPKGASFELVDAQEFIWSVLATDVDFAPNGSMYILDWVNGWDKTGKGRIWKVTSKETDPRVAEVKALLAEGMSKRTEAELAKLLGHADQRVRSEAQFELADRAIGSRRKNATMKNVTMLPGRGQSRNVAVVRSNIVETQPSVGSKNPARETLHEAARQTRSSTLARIHAIWAVGQVSREDSAFGGVLEGLTKDRDDEIRAQAVKMLGESPDPDQGEAGKPSVRFRIFADLVRDESPRVRFFAAQALAKHGRAESLAPLVELLRDNNDQDAYLRHAAVMGLTGNNDVAMLVKAAADPSPAVRMGVLLALRRLGKPEAAKFLNDSDSKIATEAGLAIYEAPIPDALPALADLATKKGLTEALQRRAINAANRVGRAEDASALATVAGRSDASKNVRVESLAILTSWANPKGRDRINGLWRPIDVRPSKVAADALRPNVKGLLNDSPDEIRRGTIAAVAELGIKEAGPDLVTLVVEAKGSSMARAEAIKALEKLDDPRLADAVEAALGAVEGRVRSEGLRVLTKISPDRAIPALAKVLDAGSTPEQQKALEVLGLTDRPEADAILATWLDRLAGKKAPASIELELLEAASKRKSAEVTDRLARFEKDRPKVGPLADHHAELEGGDAERGRKIFRDNAAVYCVRCHKVKGEGGEVGPDLTGIGTKHPRTYLLESIVAPNQAIAQGFESVILAKTDGTVVTGVLRSEDARTVKVMTAEAKLIEVPKAEIEERKRGNSAMPEDLPKKMTKSEVRDLVAFLAGLK
jgi:quinoprotein glucose dehydrogenase